MSGYETLVLGLAVFFGMHLVAGVYEVRTAMVNMMGLKVHRAFHSVFAIAGIYLIVKGFSDAPVEDLWAPPGWGVWAPPIVMPFALMLLAGAHMAKGAFQRITRHPMMWGIFLFAAAHLLANGDKASVMTFGCFAVYGLIGPVLSDRKQRLTDAEAFAKTLQTTSLVPFAAILQGRAEAAPGGAAKVVVAGLVVFGLLAWLHPYYTGKTLPFFA